jgi:hypothetical protein
MNTASLVSPSLRAEKPQRAARAGVTILAEHPNWDNSNDFNEDEVGEILHLGRYPALKTGSEAQAFRRHRSRRIWQNKPIAEKPNYYSFASLGMASASKSRGEASGLAGILAERT